MFEVVSMSKETRAAASSDRWVQVSIFLVGMILGGGGAGIMGHTQYTALDTRVRGLELFVAEKFGHLENEILEHIIRIDERLSRLEGRIDAQRQSRGADDND